MRQIILDTETTGLHPNDGHRLVEIGCIELVNRKITGQRFHAYLNPERDSDPDALKVHGLESDFLSEQPLFAQVAQELLAFVKDSEVLIHNAPFDVAFLDAELAREGLRPFKSHVEKVLDTLAMAKAQFPGKRNSLDALCQRFGIDNSQRTLHGALLDAELLADVYLALTRGQNSLDMDSHSAQKNVVHIANIQAPLAVIDLPIITATDEENSSHRLIIEDIAKSTGKAAVWHNVASLGS
jgi:DNA polymerase III subunit epsilon